MTASVNAFLNKVAPPTFELGAHALAGYLGARFFTSFNPASGAAFSAIAYVVSKVAGLLLDPIFAGKNSNVESRFLGNVIKIGASVGLAALGATAIGFAVTFQTGLILAAAALAARLFADVIGLTGLAIGGAAIIASSKVPVEAQRV